MNKEILSVSQVNQYIKTRFDADPLLSQICVSGEISNYKLYPSGHHYFTLKDSNAALRCVMFKTSAFSLRFRPENGMAVLAFGRVSAYPRDGAYQLYCDRLQPDGAGDLNVAFEQLKKKLGEEGLFASEHKKPIPVYPKRIAIITSSAGAAIHDMLRILGKRYPLCKVLLLPVRVQGEEAPPEICGAIRYANKHRIADLIITGRGGGSIEDLWAFNDERVARAIYDSEIPVISAVGHEPDVTISDYVADLRAATPSNAAELAVPDQVQLRLQLTRAQSAMSAAISKKLKLERQTLDALSKTRVLQSPLNYIQERRLQLDNSHQRLISLSEKLVAGKKQQFVRLTAALDAMSPLKVLSRGYSITYTENGEMLRSIRDTRPGASIRVKTTDGRVYAAVTSTEENHEETGGL